MFTRRTMLLVSLAALTAGCPSAGRGDADAGTEASADGALPSAQTIARFCALSAICAHPGSQTQLDVPGCAETQIAYEYSSAGPIGRSLLQRYVACASAGSCAAFDTCLLGGLSPDYCATHPALSCNGDTLIECSMLYAYGLGIDCRQYGLRCTTVGTGAGCSDGTPCTASSPASACNGNRLELCGMGLATNQISGEDCALTIAGGVCSATDGGAACVPPTTCATSDLPHCEGNVAAWCLGGYETRVDCTEVANGRCAPTDAGIYELSWLCVPSGAVCDPRITPDHCNGTSIESCVQGQIVDVDCASIGFTTCVAVPGGATCMP
jgi:hypothetical protein